MGFLILNKSSIIPAIIKPYVISWWDALKANRLQISIWNDISGNNRTLTMENFANTESSGWKASTPYSLVLDGTDDGATANNAEFNVTSAPISLAAMIKVSAGAGFGWVINRNLDNHVNTQYGLYYNPDNHRIDSYLEGAAKDTSLNNSVLENVWVLVGFTWNGTTVQTYINGVASGTPGTFSGTLTIQPNFNIGRRYPANNLFKGEIGFVTAPILKAMTAEEWKILYNANCTRFGLSKA